MDSSVSADSSDAASIGRPCQGIDIPRLGIGISGLTKRNGTRISCFYAPDVYGVFPQRCSDAAPTGGPCQAIHSLVVRCKKSDLVFPRDKDEVSCVLIPNLYGAIK